MNKYIVLILGVMVMFVDSNEGKYTSRIKYDSDFQNIQLKFYYNINQW